MRLKFVKADAEGNRRLIMVNGESSIHFACQFLVCCILEFPTLRPAKFYCKILRLSIIHCYHLLSE